MISSSIYQSLYRRKKNYKRDTQRPGFLGGKKTRSLNRENAIFLNCRFLLEYFFNKNNILKLVADNSLSEEFAEIVLTGF